MGESVLKVVAVIFVLAGISAALGLGDEADASFTLDSCVVDFDGSVTVLGEVTNDGDSGTVSIEFYAGVMGGDTHSTGLFDSSQYEVESGETIQVERRVTLDSDEIASGDCGANVTNV